MTEQDFYNTKEIKHPADLTIGDRIILETKHPMSGDEGHEYEEGYCYGYCGEEKFIRLDSGRETYAIYKMMSYKIIGKQININH